MASEIVSRAQARAQGLSRFFTGKPCKRGHIVERLAASGNCIECGRERKAAWNRKRRETRADAPLPQGMVISQADACALGYGHYFTGVPCARGHVAHRQVSSGSCVECDRVKSAAAQWHKKNRYRHNEAGRKWREMNREKRRETLRISEGKRRAQKRNSGGTHTAADLAEILKAQGNRCAYCRRSLARAEKHVDHITPLARGGSNGRDNLQYLCRPCNQSKSAKDPIEYAQSIGLLL